MTRALLGLFALALAGLAQPARLEFEVASIRPAAPLDKMVASGNMHIGMHVDGARVDIGSMAISELIQTAYKVKRFQVSGAGPDGITAQRFDIQAKLPDGANKDQVPEMLQSLLEDRFKLKIHRETKDQSVYALVVAKGGPKLKEADPEPPQDPDAAKPDEGKPTNQVQFKADGGGRGAVVSGGPNGNTKMSMGPGGMHFAMERMPIAALVELLARFVERPVVDMTELKGKYQIGMDISMDDLRGVARSMGAAMPGPEPGRGPIDEAAEPAGSILTSVQQLGLKLEPRKAPIETIVVDHVEKMPTAN